MANHKFDPETNYTQTGEEIGYVTRKNATQEDYDRIGFMSGLGSAPAVTHEGKAFLPLPGRYL